MGKICLRCNHERSAQDDPSIPETTCPKCGAIYAKVEMLLKKKEDEEKQKLADEKSIEEERQKKNEQVNEEKRNTTPQDKIPKNNDLTRAALELGKYKTNHILHLLLSIFTLSIWLVVWAIISMNNTSHRNIINEKYGLPHETNIMARILMFIFGIIFIGVVLASN